MEKKVGNFRIIALKHRDGSIRVYIYDTIYRDGAFQIQLTDETSKTEEDAINKVCGFLSGYRLYKPLTVEDLAC